MQYSRSDSFQQDIHISMFTEDTVASIKERIEKATILPPKHVSGLPTNPWSRKCSKGKYKKW